jgi:D-alanyl-D-alanine endopeptidase (penicillin-binding protein 7)
MWVRQSIVVLTSLIAAWAACSVVPALAATKAPARPPAQPAVRSGSFVVVDEESSAVILARKADVAAPIASITKLMTALVVLDAGQSLDEKLTIANADLRGTQGSASRLAAGAKLSRGDLLHLALMSSENRAAHALCRNYPGGMSACVRAMNAKAGTLGMTATRFVEPTGLSADNVASPADLARLVHASAQYPLIQEYSTDPSHTVAFARQVHEFRNTNPLVNNPSWTIGVQKTGYIAEAGRCLVMQTVIDGRNVVIVLLDSWGKLTRVADAKRIRTWMEAQARRRET